LFLNYLFPLWEEGSFCSGCPERKEEKEEGKATAAVAEFAF
jgi:hypothetical protein